MKSIVIALALLLTPTQSINGRINVNLSFTCSESSRLETLSAQTYFMNRQLEIPQDFLSDLRNCGYTFHDLLTVYRRSVNDLHSGWSVEDRGVLIPGYRTLTIVELV